MTNTTDFNVKDFFTNRDGLIRLIAINTAVFLGVAILGVIGFLFTGPGGGVKSTIVDFLAFPSHPQKFVFRFWTPVTYMFTHTGFMHFLINMLVLYFSGMLFKEFLGSHRIVNVYLLGGLFGGFLYFIAYNVFPIFNNISASNIGASAGVYAILVAVTMKAPRMPVRLFFVLNVPLWGVTVGLLVLDIIQFEVNTGGRLAHIGGAFLGYYFVTQLDKGKDISTWIQPAIDWVEKFFYPKPTLKKVYSSHQSAASQNRTRSTSNPDDEQKKVDAILDKISSSGYESLSKAEKEFLFKYGKK
ncbi:MAG: rhomboid family intramembrane serine protease [Schleiferiaceae bacterium]|nr:rhomboid family intramembrane serine protease [Schleiferiaceae bacterium]